MKKVKIITIILAIILVALVAFGGVYIQNQNRMENKVKDYQLSRELDSGRVIEIKPSEDIEGDKLTVENFKIVKNTIENRLKNLGATDYVISLNEENGLIRIELPEDEDTDLYAYYVIAQGQVQIKDKETEEELLNDSMVKDAKYNYIYNSNGYQTYVEIELTDEGQAKLEEISNDYAILSTEVEEIEEAQSETEETTEESTEETTTDESITTENEETSSQENTEELKKIAILTIGYPTTESENEDNTSTEYDVIKIEKNKITIDIGTTTSSTTLQSYMSKAAEISMLIESGKCPIIYELQNNRLEYSTITSNEIIIFSLVILALLLIALIIISIKYKLQGLLVSIAYIGFVAIFSLIIRYTNVMISIEGIYAIILILVINLKLNSEILKVRRVNMAEEIIKNTYKTFWIKLVPIIIISLVFCFAKWENLSSFGMIVFWGIILMAIYNILVTKTLLKLKENK